MWPSSKLAKLLQETNLSSTKVSLDTMLLFAIATPAVVMLVTLSAESAGVIGGIVKII